jgi:hypothetical protein
MHEQSLRANRIEGAGGEAEGLCVANLEFHGKPSISAPPDCLGDQQFAEVHAGDKAVGADRGGEFEGVSALAAADIQHPHARLQAKTVQDQGFPGDYSRQFVGLVKKMKEKAGLGALVDAREMRDFLAWGHAHIRVTLCKAPGLTTLTIGLWMGSKTRPTLGHDGYSIRKLIMIKNLLLTAIAISTLAVSAEARDGRGLRMREPYDASKTPVVLVHGLWDKESTWNPMLHALESDAVIGKRYQFMSFGYD